MANPTISQIAINGTTYDACDSQARADIKTLQDSVINGVSDIHTNDIFLKALNTDRDGSLPSSNQLNQGIYFIDKDNESISHIQNVYNTKGESSVWLCADNEDINGNALQNAFSLSLSRDGTVSYHVTGPTAFRSAISAAHDTVGARAGASWIASSSNANGVQLTNKITSFVKGEYYLVIAKYPTVTSSGFIVTLLSNGLSYLVGENSGCSIIGTAISGIAGIWLVEVTRDNAEMYLVSAASASATFTNLSRGYLMSIRLS